MTETTLRFLVDESCDFAIVRCLRALDFDVVAISENTSRSVDRDVIDEAAREGRVLVTEDKDFGWLVFACQSDSAGVILVRGVAGARDHILQTVRDLVVREGDRLRGAFVVVQPGLVRISSGVTRD